jgi:hypothetical protein
MGVCTLVEMRVPFGTREMRHRRGRVRRPAWTAIRPDQARLDLDLERSMLHGQALSANDRFADTVSVFSNRKSVAIGTLRSIMQARMGTAGFSVRVRRKNRSCSSSG